MAETASQMASAQALRARFLQNSSDALFLSSTSTSRYLRAQGAQSEHFKDTRKISCSACGSHLLPGWTTTISLARGKPKSAPKLKGREAKPQQKIRYLKCEVCHRVNKDTVTYPLKTKTKTMFSNVVGPTVQQAAQPGLEPVPEKPTKTLSSKQRAKARKDREGLQSLLNRSSQNKTTQGLSLMDLMRK
ncbi:hypothetical protein LTR84_009772 [Exophiala bonariae]|uniref:Uncharacterized protein n=1 Tax=Exophiala bonariae TaxID=1690606 RepID=A0AAV9NK78_9EURO|nr:hypothetical protein LTR84_009772 [Exophiala bonariae]